MPDNEAKPAAKPKKKAVPFDKQRRRQNAFYRFVYPFVWAAFNLVYPLKVLHRERVPEGAALVCPNHTSNADPVIIMLAIAPKGGIRAMAKQELFEIRILGWFLRCIGSFGVRRGSGDVNAIKTAIKYLRAGDKVVMFPEGHRGTDGEVQDAQNGVAMLSLRTGVPILPVYIEPIGRKFHRLHVVVGEPFQPVSASKRPTDAEYQAIGAEWKRRVTALEAEVHGG